QFLYKNSLSSLMNSQVEFKRLIKPFPELFYLFDQMLEATIRRCIILWPKKIVDRNSLEKLNSVVFERIINIRMLVHHALISFYGGDFDRFFDYYEMGIL